jgi:hypothetical protein
MFFMNRIPRGGFTLDETSERSAPPATPNQVQGKLWHEVNQQTAAVRGSEPLQNPLNGGLNKESF